MRNDSRLSMARYAEAARAHHNSRSDHEQAMYERDIDALGFHPGTKQHIIDHGMADVVGHLHANTSKRMEIAALKTPDKQIPALQKIRMGESSGPSKDNEYGSIEDTEAYIQGRREQRSKLRR